jgi:hypothetical protein
MNLPDDNSQWLKHGTVAIRSDDFGDNQGSKKTLCNGELYDLYSPNIRVFK